MQLLLYLYSTQALTWHKGKIPSDEIWLKLGGDKGGGTFKMLFQVHTVIWHGIFTLYNV